jgi:NAD+ kinase
MTAPFKTVALFGKHQAEGVAQTLGEIGAFLDQRGHTVLFEAAIADELGRGAACAADIGEIGERADLAVIVGGDGTMLGIARELAPYGVPLVGINSGRLGFITDVPIDRFRDLLGPILDGDFEEEHRAMLDGSVWRDGERIFEGLSMNDVVVSRGATAGMVELRVTIGEDFVANLRADGLIVASPTGSTAYALSAGGPILHPGIAGWVLVPIASHTLSNRPIVLPDHGEIRIEIVAGRDASANFDMQALTSLLHGDEVRVRRSQHKVRFLHPRGWSYYATLRRKLRWYEGVV